MPYNAPLTFTSIIQLIRELEERIGVRLRSVTPTQAVD
jgi:hypothetical protein